MRLQKIRLVGGKLQRISWEVFSETQARLEHGLLEAAARIKSFIAAADSIEESTMSNRTFYLVSLLLFISLLLLAPDKIPQTLATADFNPGLLDKIQEIAKKAVPFIS